MRRESIFLFIFVTFFTVFKTSGQSFTLPGDGNWYLVATKSGRHAIIEYTYNHPTAHNPSIVRGRIQFINAKTFLVQDHHTMGYNAWNQPQFAIINKGNSSELWVKSTSGISSGVFEITYSKYATLVLGETSDSNLSDNGGTLKIYDKLPDNSHVFSGNMNLVDGRLGIGTTSFGSHKLAVEGSIGAREIKVESNGWSDFVFDEDYELKSIEEVEKYIKENGHLPEIPDQETVEKNGVNLGEMNAKLLQKIEELTLYTIEQNKKIAELKKMMELQNDEIKKLKAASK
jgi:hypothetical protein